MSEISDLPKACCAREPESPENFRRRSAQGVVYHLEEFRLAEQKFYMILSTGRLKATEKAIQEEMEFHTTRMSELESQIAQSFAAETSVTEEPEWTPVIGPGGVSVPPAGVPVFLDVARIGGSQYRRVGDKLYHIGVWSDEGNWNQICGMSMRPEISRSVQGWRHITEEEAEQLRETLTSEFETGNHNLKWTSASFRAVFSQLLTRSGDPFFVFPEQTVVTEEPKPEVSPL